MIWKRWEQYRRDKLALALQLFPPGTKFSANDLDLKLEICPATAARWIVRWIAEGRLETARITEQHDRWKGKSNLYRFCA